MRSGRAAPRAARELVAAAVPGLAERMMVARVQREWAGAAGPELALRAFPLDLDHGVLAVGAETSACLQELTLRAPDIVSALGRRLGSAVTAIRPCLRRRPIELPAPATPDRPPQGAPLTPAETESVARLVAAIGDPDVAAAARRVLVKDHLAWRLRRARSHSAEPPPSPALSAPELVSESPPRLPAGGLPGIQPTSRPGDFD
jgi:hypothetical protein